MSGSNRGRGRPVVADGEYVRDVSTQVFTERMIAHMQHRDVDPDSVTPAKLRARAVILDGQVRAWIKAQDYPDDPVYAFWCANLDTPYTPAEKVAQVRRLAAAYGEDADAAVARHHKSGTSAFIQGRYDEIARAAERVATGSLLTINPPKRATGLQAILEQDDDEL